MTKGTKIFEVVVNSRRFVAVRHQDGPWTVTHECGKFRLSEGAHKIHEQIQKVADALDKSNFGVRNERN